MRGGKVTHGHAKRGKWTGTYNSWRSMRDRVKSCSLYYHKLYKAREIGIDPAWNNFSVFLRDMGERPEGHTIERVDNDKGYSKENCVWATQAAQNKNRRKTNG